MTKFAKALVLLAFFASFSIAGPVSIYGALTACAPNGKGRICGSGDWANIPVQVRGVSFSWSNTGAKIFYKARIVNSMVDDWKADIVRAALGCSDYGGYCSSAKESDPEGNLSSIKTVVDAAIAKDIYVIIDWHSHTANQEEAAVKTFFETTMAQYHNDPHVIFEIFNEPLQITWASTIKPFAERIISGLRAKGANNLVLVGTQSWSQRVDDASASPLSDNNVAYVLHFYANGDNAHQVSALSPKATAAIDRGKAVFVSEYGTTHNDGGANDKGHYNTHDATKSDAWHAFMDQNQISSVAWNVNDKYEGSAFFGTNPEWTDDGSKGANGTYRFDPTTANLKNTSMMTPSGAYIFNKLNSYAASRPWVNAQSPIRFSPFAGKSAAQLINNGISLQVQGKATLEIFNLNGSLLRKMDFSNGAYSVELSDLPKGLYIAKIRYGNSSRETLKVPVR